MKNKIRFISITSGINILTCFLSWSVQGDLIGYITRGIQFLPYFPYYQDNGGTLIALINIFILIVIKMDKFNKERNRLIKVLTIANSVLVFHQASLIWLTRILEKNFLLDPNMLPGMMLLLASSIFQIGFLLMKKLDTIETH